jgi:hypothetical protein
VLRVPLDERVRDRIVAETRGNPLALLELPRAFTPAELAGGFGPPDGQGCLDGIEDSFRRRLAGLPSETQRLMLIAAAEPVGDPVLVWQAAQQLGIGVRAVGNTDGLLAISTRVMFRHSLVRSAVYRAASPQDRQAVHRALANATDAELDPDRRAWHRAQATQGFDEDVAYELERSAGRAQARGGLAAAAAVLERAAALTVEPSRRAHRALAAAHAKYEAGAFDEALGLVAIAELGPLDEFQCAQVDVLRAQISFAASRGNDAPPLLLRAAKRLEFLDVTLARETYLDALAAATFAGRLANGAGPLEVAEAVRAAPHRFQPTRAPDLLLDGFAALITEGYGAAAPILRPAVSAFSGDELSSEEGLRWLWVACTVAGLLWDHASWDALSARLIQLARDAGALSALSIGLSTRAGMRLLAGEPATIASLAHELAAVNEATGSSMAPYASLALVAFQGREAEAPMLDRLECLPAPQQDARPSRSRLGPLLRRERLMLACLRSAHWCGCVTRCCARSPTDRRLSGTFGRLTAPRRRRPMRPWIPIATPGTERGPQETTRRWPTSSSARPAARSSERISPRRQPFSNVGWHLRSSRGGGIARTGRGRRRGGPPRPAGPARLRPTVAAQRLAHRPAA